MTARAVPQQNLAPDRAVRLASFKIRGVAKRISRALAVGAGAALKDTYHWRKESIITEARRPVAAATESVLREFHLGCRNPKDFG